MFGSAQRKQLDPDVQSRDDGHLVNLKRAFPLVQLLIGEAIGLFIAGIVVPTLLSSVRATNHALAGPSLHTLTIARVTFWYRYRDLGVAFLGLLSGAALAMAIHFNGPIGNKAGIIPILRQVHGKLVFQGENGPRAQSGVSLPPHFH